MIKAKVKEMVDNDCSNSKKDEEIFEECFEESVKAQADQKEKKEAFDVLSKFKNYISSQKFQDKASELSGKYGIPKKKIIKNFLGSFLGMVSDICHVAIGFMQDALTVAINSIDYILKNMVNMSANMLRGLVRVCTLNTTKEA